MANERLIEKFMRELMREFILLCHGNDFEKLTLLKIGDTVERLYEKYGSVDAVPVVHGRWEPHPNENGFDRCSVCRDCVIYADWADGMKWGYCPNCGAKMDGGEHESRPD